MKNYIKILLCAVALVSFLFHPTVSREALAGEAAPQIEIIFDDSGSMWGQIDGKAKIDIAKESFDLMLDDILKKQSDAEVGLRVYGHKNKKCDNSILEVPLGKGNSGKLKAFVNRLKPLGMTPITYSLQESAKDFDSEKKGEKIVVLLTDGIESCNGDPCAAAKSLQEAGVVTKIHVVGFGMKKSELDTLKCIAAPSGGLLIGAGNSAELKKAFERVVDETVKYNLEVIALDDSGKALYADCFVYPAGQTEKVAAHGDTSLKDRSLFDVPPGTYDIKVVSGQTKKELWLKGVTVDDKKRTSKRVVFGERDLKIVCKKADGSINGSCDVYVYEKSGKDVMHADTSMGYAAIKLEPGIYNVKIINYYSKKEKWLKDVDLTSTKKFSEEVTIE
ncbi:MAG TPA: VWA domain-containing protein [Oscillospiraceae bacterium]|nr:VWA domain-containing protein [Oscillospiraceae bacterium]